MITIVTKQMIADAINRYNNEVFNIVKTAQMWQRQEVGIKVQWLCQPQGAAHGDEVCLNSRAVLQGFLQQRTPRSTLSPLDFFTQVKRVGA
jgi:hypothetical protein